MLFLKNKMKKIHIMLFLLKFYIEHLILLFFLS